jgi:hypothetical protein
MAGNLSIVLLSVCVTARFQLIRLARKVNSLPQNINLPLFLAFEIFCEVLVVITDA